MNSESLFLILLLLHNALNYSQLFIPGIHVYVSIELKSYLWSAPTNLKSLHKALCSDIEFVWADHRPDFNHIAYTCYISEIPQCLYFCSKQYGYV